MSFSPATESDGFPECWKLFRIPTCPRHASRLQRLQGLAPPGTVPVVMECEMEALEQKRKPLHRRVGIGEHVPCHFVPVGSNFQSSVLETSCLREVYYGLGLPDSLNSNPTSSSISIQLHRLSPRLHHSSLLSLTEPLNTTAVFFSVTHCLCPAALCLHCISNQTLLGCIVSRTFFQKDARRKSKREKSSRRLPVTHIHPASRQAALHNNCPLQGSCSSLDPRVFTLKETHPDNTRCISTAAKGHRLPTITPISTRARLSIFNMPRGAYDVSATNNPRPKPNPK